MSGLGTPDGVDSLISEYYPAVTPGLGTNETDVLLAALLMELKAQRLAGGDSEEANIILEQARNEHGTNGDAEGVYHASTATFDASEWVEVEFGFSATEVDLRRISGGIRVAFADPTDDQNVIEYAAADDPLAGLSVTTSSVHLRAQDGEGSQTVRVEGWQ